MSQIMPLLSEAIGPLFGAAALWIGKRIADAMKELKSLPQKLEETTQRIEKKHDERMTLFEGQLSETRDIQLVMQEQLSVAFDKLGEQGPARK